MHYPTGGKRGGKVRLFLEAAFKLRLAKLREKKKQGTT